MKKILAVILLCSFSVNLFAKEAILRVFPSNKYGQEIEASFSELGAGFVKLPKSSLTDIAKIDLKSMDVLIDLLNNFIAKNGDGELVGRAQYMLAECYQFKAFNIYFNNYDEATYRDFLNKSINEYNKAKKNKYLSDFFIQNLDYRLAEISFGLGEYKVSFDMVKKYPYNYLSSDVFFLLAVIYINLLNKSQIENSSWTEVKDVLDSIKFKKGIEDKFAVTSGITAFAMEDYLKAIDYFKQFESEDTKYFLGKSYENQNQFIFAIGEYRYLLNNFPNTKYKDKALVSIAECLYKSSDYTFAIETYQSYLKTNPKSPHKLYITYKIALSYYKLKDYVKAIEFFGKIYSDTSEIEIRELKMYAKYMEAYSYFNMGKYEEAAASFLGCSKSYAEEQEGIKSVFMAGFCYYKLKKYAKAEEILKQRLNTLLIEDKTYYYMYSLLANCQYENGLLEDASETYYFIVNKIQKEEFFDLRDRAFFMLNLVTYQQKNYKRIVTEFQNLLYKINPDINGSEVRTKTYFLVADACYKFQYYQEAKALFSSIAKEYIQNDVLYSKAIDGLAWCDFKEKNYASAARQRKIISDIIDATSDDLGELKYYNYSELGNIYFNQKDYMKAVESYEHYLSVSDNKKVIPEVLFNLANCYYREEYYSVAIQKWQDLVDKYPKNDKALEALYKVADTYYKSGMYDKAIVAYRQMLVTFDKNLPKVVEAALRIPQSYFNAKDYNNAIVEFKKFVLMYPNTDKIQEAVDLIESTIYRKQEYEAYRAGKEVVEINIAEEMEKALKDFIEENSRLPVITDIIFRLSKNYFEEGNFEKSLEWSYKFFKLGNYSSFDKAKIVQAQYYFAESYYNLKKYQEAIKEYNNLIKNFPEFENLDKVYIKLGTAHLNEKEYKKSIEAYNTLLAKFPKTEYKEIIYYNLGISYKELGDITAANKAFIDYYNLNPASESSIQLMIEVGDLYVKKRDYSNAIVIYTQILPSLNDVQKIYAQYKIAEAYEKQFDFEKSIPEYLKLLDMAPVADDVRLSGLIRLAEIYQERKQYQDAKKIYDHVIKNTANEEWKSALGSRIKEIEYLLSEAAKPAEAKPEAKPEVKAEVKPEVKPLAKAENKIKNKIEEKGIINEKSK